MTFAAYHAREFDPEPVEAGRLLFARECRFVFGTADPAALPPESLPEVAFIGRSNVGKSSLVNALTGRRLLARTSNTPGRTRQLNFFDLGGRLMLVDLPGYGYAEASKTAIKAWTGLVHSYLRRRGTLRRALLLLDARHGIMAADRPILALCDEAALSYQAVLTKADKLSATALRETAETVASELSKRRAAHPEIHVTSAEKNIGIAELRATLTEIAEPETARRDAASPAAVMAMSRQPR